MADKENKQQVFAGIYNVDYFSGSQVALYIGDILVDEVTSISYSVQQSKRPLYGYSDTLFREVSHGQVLVQGQFTINFKEAGYLWLILDRYRKFQTPVSNRIFPTDQSIDPNFVGPPSAVDERTNRDTIERVVAGDTSLVDRYKLLTDLAAQEALTGFPGGGRSTIKDPNSVGPAENIFEAFEDAVWKGNSITGSSGKEYKEEDRRCDNPNLNGFDIYIAFGDYAGQNALNHTMQKIENVHILGTSKEIQPDGMCIQEMYQFVARNLV
jgi:hypothetical protein